MAEITPVYIERKPHGRKWLVHGSAAVTSSGGHIVTGLTHIEYGVGETSLEAEDCQVTRNSNDGTQAVADNGLLWLDASGNCTVYFQAIGTRLASTAKT